MKIKRQKKVNRNMHFFRNNYGFRLPYQILIDGTFCVAAKKGKINIVEHLNKYFNCEVKIMTTQCVIIEAEIFGRDLRGGLEILKQYKHHKCGHEGKPIPAFECLQSMLGAKNDNRYIVATNDSTLQKAARYIPGVPVLYLRNKTPILQPPSETSKRMADLRGRESLKVNDGQREALLVSKKRLGIEEVVQPQKKKKKKKKQKGPNHLSHWKKNYYYFESSQTGFSSETYVPSDNTEHKRKRKRIKLPQHVKEHFREMLNNKEICM